MTTTNDRLAAAGNDRLAAAGAENSAVARRSMIDSQLRTSGVNQPWVLAAMGRIAREDFVPAAARAAAYGDRAVALDGNRYLAAPLVHGRMLAEAAPMLADAALLIGAPGGYLEALLRPLVGALDVVDPADLSARRRKKAKYTLIIIDGAAEQLPETLAAMLAEGGRVVTGLVQRGITRLAAGRCTGGTLSMLPLAEIGIPVLPEFAAPRRWSF